MGIDQDLYERLMDKFGYYQEVIDAIVNIKSQELDSLVSFLIDKIQTNKMSLQIVYKVICQVCEVSIACINEYWYLYEQIYLNCKTLPKIRGHDYIIQELFGKKYKNIIIWQDDHSRRKNKYKMCKKKTFDEILNYYESDPIMKCIIHDDIKSLKEIIISSPNFYFSQQKFGKSLIENCCFCGAVECFKFLRSNGIQINKLCLDLSIDGRNKSIIDECLHCFEPDYETVCEAIKVHNFEMAISFIQMSRIEFIDISKTIAEFFDIRLFFYMVSDPFYLDVMLLDSIDFQDQELINFSLRLANDIDIKSTEDIDGRTLLFKAAGANNVDLIEKLVELGLDVERCNDNGKTPLMEAASKDCAEAIAKLVELGANVNGADEYLRTPLFEAAKRNCVEAIAKLVELGADLEAQDEYDRTPLFEAAWGNSVEAIAKLVELGANINASIDLGKTAYSEACCERNEEAKAKLKELGAKVNEIEEHHDDVEQLGMNFFNSNLYIIDPKFWLQKQ